MGALEIFAEVWPKGREVVTEVKTIARDLLSLGPGACGSTVNSSSEAQVTTPKSNSDVAKAISATGNSLYTTRSNAELMPVYSTEDMTNIIDDETPTQAGYFTSLHHSPGGEIFDYSRPSELNLGVVSQSLDMEAGFSFSVSNRQY
jgi:hypothetical protein